MKKRIADKSLEWRNKFTFPFKEFLVDFTLCESFWSACSKAPKMKFMFLNWLISRKWKVKGFLHILKTQTLSLCNSFVYFSPFGCRAQARWTLAQPVTSNSDSSRVFWEGLNRIYSCYIGTYLQHSLMWSQIFYNLKCYLKHFKCNTKMRNPQVSGCLGFFNLYRAAFPMTLLFFSFFKVQFAQRTLEYEGRCVQHCQSRRGDTKYVFEICSLIPCIRLLYLNIRNFGYMPIVLSLKKCCGHNKQFHKKCLI